VTRGHSGSGGIWGDMNSGGAHWRRRTSEGGAASLMGASESGDSAMVKPRPAELVGSVIQGQCLTKRIHDDGSRESEQKLGKKRLRRWADRGRRACKE
jgi:hypothetical protein